MITTAAGPARDHPPRDSAISSQMRIDRITMPSMTIPNPPMPSGQPPTPVPNALLQIPPGPQYRSEDLLGSGDEALIVHAGQVYRLRRTGTGKLILTK
jgi:hemin uptake protein HemP